VVRISKTDDVLSEFEGEGAGQEGNLGVLGSTPPQGNKPVHQEVPTRLNWRELRPSELTGLLNSTPLGAVINERQLYRHRSRAGFRIGDGKRVDLLRYVAWLVEEKETKRPTTSGPGSSISMQDILSLIEHQGYRCALSDRELTPETAALDHVMPVSRGGEHQIENAQVLHKEVNRAKGTLTNEEFVQLCCEVAAHAKQQGENA